MSSFAVLETEDGLTVVEIQPGGSALDAAEEQGAVLADETLYATYQDAYDAMLIVPTTHDVEEDA